MRLALALALLAITGCCSGMSCECTSTSASSRTWSADGGAQNPLFLTPDEQERAITFCDTWCRDVRK